MSIKYMKMTLRVVEQNLEKVVRTFLRQSYKHLKDYADSSIRYLRATGLFTLLPHGQTLALTKAKIDDSMFLLEKYGTSVSDKTDVDYEDYCKNYFR
jgi:hypothetical protein